MIDRYTLKRHIEKEYAKLYIESEGVKCINPDCGSEDIESIGSRNPVSNCDGSYSLDVICNACRST